ncbi:hypothetical protein ACHAXT_011024 [Thalassiosira profunda]
MMRPETPAQVILERPVEVYENQRLWIGRGFSSAGLLPTERRPFSTADGSLGWMTIREAGLALLRGEVATGTGKLGANGKGVPKTVVARRGWSFHEEGEDDRECSTEDGEADEKYCGFVPCTDPEDGPVDEDGWQYFPDFLPPSLTNPNRKRGMLDFVRRRKLRRVAVFRPDHFLPRAVYGRCDYCDSKIVAMLSEGMLDALALATLFAHGAKAQLADAQAIPLKSKLVDSLCVGRNCSDEDLDPWVAIDKIKDRLCNFADTCVGKPGTLTHLINPGVDQNVMSAMPGRRKAVSKYLGEQERLYLARLLIKDVDRFSYIMHCKRDSCSCANTSAAGSDEEQESECEFRLIACVNEHCNATFSYKYRQEHDEECGYKLLPCPSGCGTEVMRKEVHSHVRDKCSLRAAECPLGMLGCTAIVQAQDITSHLNGQADKHFMLMATRMAEYQTVMKDLSAQVRLLEEKNRRLERRLQWSTTQLQSKDEAKVATNEMKRLTKRLATLEGTCKREFKKVEQDRRSHQK